MKPIYKLLFLSYMGSLCSCETLFPSPTTDRVVKTTQVLPDGTTMTTEMPIADPQRQAHAEATKSLFSE